MIQADIPLVESEGINNINKKSVGFRYKSSTAYV